MSPSKDEHSLTIQIDRNSVRQVIVKHIQRKGMFVAEAEIVAERMIEADLSRCASHGIRSLRMFLDSIDLGDIDPRARMNTVCENTSMAVLDGGTGMGHVATTRAMQMAVEKARPAGIASVVVRNSRPAGDLAGVARIAANGGLIGLVISSFQDLGSDAQVIGWALPGPVELPVLSGQVERSRLDAISQVVCTLLSAGLSGSDVVGRRRKAVAASNAVEYAIVAVEPSQFGNRDAMLELWRPIWSDALSNSVKYASTSAIVVPYTEADSRLVAELATEAQITVTW